MDRTFRRTTISIGDDGTNFQNLISFTGTNAINPYGSLTIIGSTMYGMTQGSSGGPPGERGNIFSVGTNGTNYLNLLAFSGSNGEYPTGSLTLAGATLYGTTPWGGIAAANNSQDYVGNGAMFGLNIAPATVGLASPQNATIITGGTATLGMTVSNSPTAGYNLNYSMAAALTGGTAALGNITPSSGSLAPGASQSCTIPATSTTLGVNTLSFTASDPNSSNLSQSSTATLTVLDHSNASLSSTATQTSQTISFGNVLRGANVPSQNFTIYNLAANTTAALTANLKLTGFSADGDPALSTNLAPFNGLTAASGSNGETFTATLNTGSFTTSGTAAVTMSASQLADDSGFSGAGNNNNGGITVTLVGNVGNAMADNSNSRSTFGPAWPAVVVQARALPAWHPPSPPQPVPAGRACRAVRPQSWPARPPRRPP